MCFASSSLIRFALAFWAFLTSSAAVLRLSPNDPNNVSPARMDAASFFNESSSVDVFNA